MKGFVAILMMLNLIQIDAFLGYHIRSTGLRDILGNHTTLTPELKEKVFTYLKIQSEQMQLQIQIILNNTPPCDCDFHWEINLLELMAGMFLTVCFMIGDHLYMQKLRKDLDEQYKRFLIVHQYLADYVDMDGESSDDDSDDSDDSGCWTDSENEHEDEISVNFTMFTIQDDEDSGAEY